MRCGIVNSKDVLRFGRLDASFYLGDEQIPNEVAKADQNLKRAQQRVKNAQKALKEEQKRVSSLAFSGVVKQP
jgi:hypothetical protein